MREILISFVFALIVGSAVNGYLRPQATADAQPPAPDETAAPAGSPAQAPAMQAIAETSQGRFSQDVLSSQEPVLVEFSAKWCAPCKMMAPTLEALASEYQGRAKVLRVDVDGNPQLSVKYNVHVLPTMILFKDGKPVETRTGFTIKDTLVAAIEKHLN